MKVLHKSWHELQILFFCSLLKIFIVPICRHMPTLNVHLIVMWWGNVIQWVLRSSISQCQSSLHTQSTQYQNSEIEDVIQLHLIHTNKLYREREGKVCNKATNNGSKANMNSCTSFTSNIVALTYTCNCRFSDQQQQQQMERQKTQIPFEISACNKCLYL